MKRTAFDLYMKHGTTFNGLLRLGHELDCLEYNHYVNGIDPKKFVKKDPRLRQLLIDLKKEGYELFCFSNADARHVLKMIKYLEIFDIFCPGVDEKEEDFEHPLVCCMEQMSGKGDIIKPDPIAYKQALKHFELSEEEMKNIDSYFIEDSVHNAIAGTKYFTKCFCINPKHKMRSLSLEKKTDYMKSIKDAGVVLIDNLYDIREKLL